MIKSVIFDIDGVLLDSFEANFQFFSTLMKQVGYTPPTRERYVTLFHRTLHDTVQILTDSDSELEIKRICDLIDAVEAPSPILTKGVPEVIKKLSEKYSLGIVTSRIKAYAYEPPLNTLEPFFRATVAYEDTENHKPHPEPLLLAAKQLNVLPEECIYVGDVKSDLDAAHAAGMKFILFSKDKIEGIDKITFDFSKIPELMGMS